MKISFVGILFFFLSFTHAQTQIGQDIEGEGPNDRCGYKIASSEDGNRLAIAYQSPYEESNDTGKVKIFDWDGTNWVESGAIFPNTADNLAYDMAADIVFSNDGNRLAVGYVGGVNSSNQLSRGKVEVYEWINNTWQQLGQSIEGGYSDGTGFSVALSGNGKVLAVPAYRFSFVGKINTFIWDENTVHWLEFGNDLYELNVTNTSNFGQSVDLSNDGSYMIVGAPASTEFGDDSGAAFYYTRNQTDSRWDRIDFFTGGLENQRLGWDVAISGDGGRFAISSSGFTPNGDTGEIALYQYVNQTISSMGNPIVGGNTTEYVGYSIDLSLDGEKLIYGSPFEPTESFGRVVAKMWNGSIWQTIGNPIPGVNNEDRFGLATAISGNGNRFFGGTKYKNQEAGEVRVYEISTLGVAANNTSVGLNLYPNPTNRFVYLDQAFKASSKVNIYDMSGRLLGQARIMENRIDLSSYPSGILLTEIQYDNTFYRTKIVKH